MPGLSSFITYRPGKKAKIKSPFSLLQRDNSSTAASIASYQQFTTPDVIDINNSRHSLDFDGGRPLDSFEEDVFDDPKSSQPTRNSPQVELDIDLSSSAFSDWLEAFSGPDAKQEAIASLKRLSRLKNSAFKTEGSKNGEGGANEGEDFASSSEDIVASLRAMNASYFGTLPEYDGALQVRICYSQIVLFIEQLNQASSPKYFTPSSLTAPDDGSPNNSQTSRARSTDLSIGISMTNRPLSTQSDLAGSSALSGTTIARALMTNSFILSADRSSRYRSGIGAGLTRSDSTTLPRGDSFSMFNKDTFSIEPDAPPVPLDAEFLYEPPKKSRNEEKRTKHNLRRRSSTGSLTLTLLPEAPSISGNTRPNSVVINAGADSDLSPKILRVKPSVPQSPLPRNHTPRQTIDEATTPDQASTPASFQEVTQQFPVDAQLLSPDFNILSPAPSSEGHASPRELEGLLNYYSIPDSPELFTVGGGFRPMFSPISEESLSQLSPPFPYHNDRRDSQRSQPVGTRSPLSMSLRVGDSTLSPRKDQRADPPPQVLLPVGGVQSNYAPGDDNPDSPLAPPQLSKIFNRQRSGSAPSPIRVVRDSKDMNAYNITVTSLSGDATPSEDGTMISQEFPETPDAFSPMFSPGPNASPSMTFQLADGLERSLMPTAPMSAANLGRSLSHSVLVAPLLLNRASARQGSLNRIRTTTAVPSTPSKRIAESPEAKSSTLSSMASDAITEIPQPEPSEQSATTSQSNLTLSADASGTPSPGPNTGQDASDSRSSLSISPVVDIDSASRMRMKYLPAIPMISPIVRLSPDHESPPVSLPGSTTSVVLVEPIVAPPSPTPSQVAKISVPRGRLPPALTISKHTSVSGPDGPVAINGTEQSGQDSPELQQPQHDSPEAGTPAFGSPFPTQSSLVHTNKPFRGRASDIFRGTSLGSPPPYYSLVSETLVKDNRPPNLHSPGIRPSSSQSQGSDNIAGPASAESTSTQSNDDGKNLVRNSVISQRARIRPPLPAGPRRPSQQTERRGSVSSVASSSVVPDLRRPSARHNNPAPSPSFQAPTPKWKGYTMEVAKWTFTSAQLQAIVSRAIRQSAEASSIRLLRLEVLDNEIPDEIQRLISQRTDIKIRYKASTRRRATILDSLHSSLSAFEDGSSTNRLLRQLDELKEVTQTLDRLAEEIHSVDQQLAHLESLTHIHTGSALAMALRKLNSSFLKQVAENQVLRSQVQALEAERDEAWQQAQNVANDYDQISESVSSSKRSSRVSAIRRSTIRVSRAGLRTPSQRLSQRSSVSSGGLVSSRSPRVPPMPRRRPMDIFTDSPIRSSATLSTSGITPTSEARALAHAQDELYAMLGITNPERSIHRSRSEIGPGSPIAARSLSPQSGESFLTRRSSLPGALSLAEAYKVMAADRNAVLATIDMLSTTE